MDNKKCLKPPTRFRWPSMSYIPFTPTRGPTLRSRFPDEPVVNNIKIDCWLHSFWALYQLLASYNHHFWNDNPISTWWLIPLSKWVITPVINGISRVNPLIIGVITHLRAVG